MFRPACCASACTPLTWRAVSSKEMPREIVENNASQFRIAKAWPVADAPAFMINGRVPPWGFGFARTPLQLEKTPIEIEILVRRPGELDDIEPLLCVFVARLVIAQCRAEHLELALVPAAYDIEAEASFADMICGDEFLGRDQRREQRRMHGAEHSKPLGLG